MSGAPRRQRDSIRATGSEYQPISLDDDDDDAALSGDDIEIGNFIQRRNELRNAGYVHLPIMLEDNDEDDEAAQAEEDRLIEQEVADIQRQAESIDLTGDDEDEPDEQVQSNNERPANRRRGRRLPRPRALRNPDISNTHDSKRAYIIQDVEYKIGQFVELREDVGPYRFGFVRIASIWVHKTTREMVVRGFPYSRNRNLSSLLPKKQNEVCIVMEIDEDDDRPETEQAIIEIPFANIMRHRNLAVTNQSFPNVRFDPVAYKTKEERENEGPLICRWQMELKYQDYRYRKLAHHHEFALIHLTERDDIVGKRYRGPDIDKLREWRGGKTRGGSYIPNPVVVDDDNNDEDEHAKQGVTHSLPGQKYTVVDTFSGAGGFSRGAKMAGFKVIAAVDHWSHANTTYKLNFPDTRLYNMDIFDFIQTIILCADIVHISPPCQFWSPAHTIAGGNDEANIVALFSCTELVEKIKPRIFTLEQTFGLTQKRHRPFFNALIEGFTRHGYSVRWKVQHLVKWGLPQTRKRLVMIGSCPGEKLPSWPADTHSENPQGNQKPLATIRPALENITRNRWMHNVDSAIRRDKVPLDADAPLGITITCGSSGAYHPSGKRDLTFAELASIQGFPPQHRWPKNAKCIKKQIGNAFPSCCVNVLLRHAKKSLEDSDGVDPAPPLLVMDLTVDERATPRRAAIHLAPERMVAQEDLNGNLANEEAVVRALQESAELAEPPEERMATDHNENEEVGDGVVDVSRQASIIVIDDDDNANAGLDVALGDYDRGDFDMDVDEDVAEPLDDSVPEPENPSAHVSCDMAILRMSQPRWASPQSDVSSVTIQFSPSPNSGPAPQERRSVNGCSVNVEEQPLPAQNYAPTSSPLKRIFDDFEDSGQGSVSSSPAKRGRQVSASPNDEQNELPDQNNHNPNQDQDMQDVPVETIERSFANKEMHHGGVNGMNEDELPVHSEQSQLRSPFPAPAMLENESSFVNHAGVRPSAPAAANGDDDGDVDDIIMELGADEWVQAQAKRPLHARAASEHSDDFLQFSFPKKEEKEHVKG